MKKNIKINNLISIVMPVYNAGDFLVEAVQSIINQTYKNWELIAINDGSTDKSLELLKKFAKNDHRIRIITFDKRKGMAAALNKGLDLAKGYYIARMDADDISLPKRLVTQMNYLIRNKNIVAVGSQVRLIDEKGKKIGYKIFSQDANELYKQMATMMAIQHPVLFTYAHLIKKCRYANHVTAEDVSMFFKLLQYGNFSNTKETLFMYRIRNNSNSLKDPKKTFNLTLKSRINAVIKLGYKPTLQAIILNMLQLITISILPKNAILYIYELIRFRHLRKQNQVNKMLVLKNKLSLSLQ